MPKEAGWSLWIAEGGWVMYSAKGKGPGRTWAAWIRFRDRDGRLVACEVRLEDEDGIDTDRLRDLPLGLIASMVNTPQETSYLREWLGNVEAQQNPGMEGMKIAPWQPTASRRRLPVPKGGPGRDHGDDFYRKVADQYAGLASTGDRAPAATLADINNVPVSTARRWVKEARLRGFLPPGIRGKAG